MAGAGKRNMPDNAPRQGVKRRKGASGKWAKYQNRSQIETGDWGVFVTCDLGRESKCIAESLDLFSEGVEKPAEEEDKEEKKKEEEEEEQASNSDDDDIEAQIRREIEGLKPAAAKSRPFRGIRTELPCVSFIRFDKAIDPEKLVHQLCLDAYANPERKRSRFIQRMTPVRSIRKVLSVDLETFAREILKPHFHSGGPPKKYAIRPTVRGNSQYNRDSVIKIVADVVGPEHPVDLKNYDLIILVDIIQNVMGMSVAGSDYDKLKKYNIAELYNPKPQKEKS